MNTNHIFNISFFMALSMAITGCNVGTLIPQLKSAPKGEVTRITMEASAPVSEAATAVSESSKQDDKKPSDDVPSVIIDPKPGHPKPLTEKISFNVSFFGRSCPNGPDKCVVLKTLPKENITIYGDSAYLSMKVDLVEENPQTGKSRIILRGFSKKSIEFDSGDVGFVDVILYKHICNDAKLCGGKPWTKYSISTRLRIENNGEVTATVDQLKDIEALQSTTASMNNSNLLLRISNAKKLNVIMPVLPTDPVGRIYYLMDVCRSYPTFSYPPKSIKSPYRDAIQIMSKTQVTLLGYPGNDGLEVVPFDPNVFRLSDDLKTLVYKGESYAYSEIKPSCK